MRGMILKTNKIKEALLGAREHRLERNEKIMASDDDFYNKHPVTYWKDQMTKEVIRGVTFENIKLQPINREDVIYGMTFDNVLFKDLTMTKITFENCVFNHCTFKNTFLDIPTFKNCTFDKVMFADGVIVESLFDNCKARKLQFVGSIISGQRFNNSIIKRVNYTKCRLYYVLFDKTNMNQALIEESKLDFVGFYKVQLVGSRLIRNQLNFLSIERSNATKVQFIANKFMRSDWYLRKTSLCNALLRKNIKKRSIRMEKCQVAFLKIEEDAFEKEVRKYMITE